MKYQWITLLASLFGILFGIIIEPIISEYINSDLNNTDTRIWAMEVIQSLFLIVLFLIVGYIVLSINKLRNEFSSNHKEILSNIGTNVVYFPINKNKDNFFKKLSESISNSKSEILILSSYLSQEKSTSKIQKGSNHREKYYSSINEKLNNISSERDFKFRRIIQADESVNLKDINDKVFLEHLVCVSRTSEIHPESCQLRLSDRVGYATYFLIDRKILYWEILEVDPYTQEYFTKGYFIFETVDKDFMTDFVRLFKRIEAKSNYIDTKVLI